MSHLPELKEPPYHRCMLSCLLNPTQTLVYKMPESPLDSGFQSIQWMNIFFREPKMIIKTFANTQYPQIETLSHKNQLITQPAAFGLSIFSARHFAKHCEANKDVGARPLDRAVRHTSQTNRKCKGGREGSHQRRKNCAWVMELAAAGLVRGVM